ncbi:hypothetical protein NKDENANG_02237 [Candidatus Entotheonellaceae bacterium PAL068K]
MSILNDQRVIAIEEHSYDANGVAHFQGVDTRTGGFVQEQLEDASEARIQSMDAAGIDVQVLSYSAPSTQRWTPRPAFASPRRLTTGCTRFVRPTTDLPVLRPCRR